MYARIKHSGSRQYLQLVEGRRDDTGKVKQRVVASLGRVDQLKDGSLDALIGGLQKVAGRHTSADSATANLPQFSQALAFGHVYLLHELW